MANNTNDPNNISNNGLDCFNMMSVVKTLDDTINVQLPENIRSEVFKNRNPTTMTMEEFAEMQMKHMHEHQEKAELHEHKKKMEDDDIDKDSVADKQTMKDREWDDWKDDHPKGSGNRMGK